MKKIVILLLLPVMLLGQSPGSSQAPRPKQPARDWLGQHDDVAHFYGSFFTNEIAYSVSVKLFPKWTPGKRLAFSCATTLVVISAKERWDMLKKNPTGWSWDDWLIGCWAIPIYCIVRICLNDWRSYVDPFESVVIKTKAPKKWSLKRMGFLR